jgi:cytokinin dehydrogenase
MMTADQAVDVTTSVEEDFGHVLRGTPTGIIHPRTPGELADTVRDAVASGSKLTLRGLAHSAGGQALPAGSVVVDLSQMNAVGPVDPQRRTIRCEAGALLRDVVAATLEDGLLPRALTNLLDLTVGGVLSVGGGIGQGSHLHGPLAANVAGMEVVTGDGSVRSCSRTNNRDLYDAVLGGLGRCGAIVSAELELRPVLSRIRTYFMLYDDVHRWLEDQQALARSGVVDSMEGLCSPSIQGLRGTEGRRASFAEWFFPLQVSLEYLDAVPELPAGLSPFRIVHVEDDSIDYFTMRHDMRFEMVKRLGAWERPHPYISAFIGADALAEILPAVLDALPLFLGDANRGAFFMAADNAPRLMALPDAEDVVFFNVIYPQILPQFLDDALGALQRAGDLLVGAGGKRYVADWLGTMDEDRWRGHYGSRYEWWVDSKRTFDPHGVFCSLLLA